MKHSVCNLIRKTDRTDEIIIYNFIYEKKPAENGDYFRKSHYKLLICTGGNAALSYNGAFVSLAAGDLLFTFPDSAVTLVDEEDFTFIYITFDGIVAGSTLRELGVDKKHYVFTGYGECLPTCENCIGLSNADNSYFLAKSAMLFIFACMKSKAEKQTVPKKALVSDIKTFIENRYSDPFLSVDTIAKYFSYNKNYISTVFKKETGVSIVRYINDVRINTACALAGNITSVKDIALLCGFSDPMYFSRLFRQSTGLTPREYIKMKNQGSM